jgi:hypothetical protein
VLFVYVVEKYFLQVLKLLMKFKLLFLINIYIIC